MQGNPRKTVDRKAKKENEDSKKVQDEKLKKSVYTISTPRDYGVAKTNLSDIYAQKKNVAANAPRKVPSISTSRNMSPMTGMLKSSASSVSQLSRTSERSDKTPVKNMPRQYSAKSDAKSLRSNTRNETPRKELFTNVSVNSPVVKKKLNLNSERSIKEVSKKVLKTKEIGAGEPTNNDVKDLDVVKLKKAEGNTIERQRTKTRTLEESEVKVLTPEQAHNNAEMFNLSSKLLAKPKAFYVKLDEDKLKAANKEPSDEEEVSYEDDFESYESDFDSYHSEKSEVSAAVSQASSAGETSEQSEKHFEGSLKENDERELDSGNFELRDARSAKSKPGVMDDILEDVETIPEHSTSMEENKRSLDEGFQDMSSSSSSMRTGEAERPLFLDFTKSKRNKLKRRINERLTQRAKDLFNFISLHEMTFSLFEMQPISYDLYMATFGRSNYTQSGVQTFDDGITQEIQTDEVTIAEKWTQCPIKFSKHNITQNTEVARKYSMNSEDYFANITFLSTRKLDDDAEKQIIIDENYKENPLRILFEQKDGVGSDKMLPYETYKTKLKNRDYSIPRLSKFLKKVESKVSHILSKNTGSKDFTDLEKSVKLPFSNGHVTISPKTIQDPKFSFLMNSKITGIFYSDTKSNILLTVHKNARGIDGIKSLLCLWDLSVAREPVKILLAIDNILIGKFRGNTDGIFVAALEDGSIHLWDLSEEPSWWSDVATSEKSPELLEFQSQELTQMEKDREWNMKTGKVGILQLAIVYSPNGAKICYQPNQGEEKSVKNIPQITSHIPCALQSCAYTSSAVNMNSVDSSDRIVGLEFMASQVVSLQRIGIITIWSIVQDKKTSKDIGKAFWSKIKLEKLQTINISEHIDISIQENTHFNLNSAKRRLSQRKNEKPAKRDSSRPKTASKFDFDNDRPFSAASLRKKVLSIEINEPKSWENGIVCNDLKIVNLNNVNVFLVAKNSGEVLCCKRCLGVLRVERFSVASNTTSITCLDVSSEAIPYFLAATDTGTVSLCSLLENRVLLTLDCRNVPTAMEKCQSDHKGRFVSSATLRSNSIDQMLKKISVSSVVWSPVNHCCIFALLHDGTLLVFDLTQSDIMARSAVTDAAVATAYSQHTLALLTPGGELQIHRLSNEEKNKEYMHLFNKYVALL